MARCFSGQRLRETRIAAGLRPERLALDIQRTAAAVQAYELGRATPPVNVAVRIAEVLGCSLDDLLVEIEGAADVA